MNKFQGYIYILSNKRNGALYSGVTSNLLRRITEHKEGKIEGFTKKYGTTMLIYYEVYSNIGQAIYREKCLKEWHRDWKIKLIEKDNSTWQDFYSTIQ